jgi:hypothetical protein
MWSEVFARCDHPSAAVRWSAPQARTLDGIVVVVPAIVVANADAVASQAGLDVVVLRPVVVSAPIGHLYYICTRNGGRRRQTGGES